MWPILLPAPHREKQEGREGLTGGAFLCYLLIKSHIFVLNSHFFSISTTVIPGLSLLPKLLTEIFPQCVSLAFLNPIDDNKLS